MKPILLKSKEDFSFEGERYLTKNKNYIADTVIENGVMITCDDGYRRVFDLSQFNNISELRDKRIDEIINS